jgi:hypothetical protein
MSKLPRAPRGSRESGYAMFVALLMVATFLITSQMVLQHFATEGRRQREQRMIWCGEQYARAIKLFFRKAGRNPQSVDELKQGIPGVHFLRIEAYKNPMDPEEGNWRFISVNAAGQIIGSVRYATLQQMAYLELNNMQPDQPGAAGSSSGASSGASSQNSSQQSSGAPPVDDGCGPPYPGAPAAGGQSGTDQASSGTTSGSSTNAFSNSSNQSGQSSIGQPLNGQPVNPYAGLQPTGPVDGPVIGASITGVGGPKDEDVCSVARYQGGRKYSQWEFIWNPVLDQARALQQSMSPATTPPAGQPAPATGPNNNPPATPSGQQTPPPTTY